MSALADPRRVWITRTQPHAQATAARVAALGLTPVVAPLLEARFEPDAAIDLAGIDALAFTSLHAVEAFAGLSPARGLPVFTVGRATADAARAAGFADVTSADGDVRVLAEAIAAASPRPTRILNPTARAPAADLAALLAPHAVAVVPVVVYATHHRPAGAAPGQADAVLVHSARAAQALAAALAGDPAVARLDAYVLSEAVAAPLRGLGLRAITVAAYPDEASLLALLAP